LKLIIPKPSSEKILADIRMWNCLPERCFATVASGRQGWFPQRRGDRGGFLIWKSSRQEKNQKLADSPDSASSRISKRIRFLSFPEFLSS